MLEEARERYHISMAHHMDIVEQLADEDPRAKNVRDPLPVVRAKDDGIRRVYAEYHPYKQSVKGYFQDKDPKMLRDTIARPNAEGRKKEEEDAYRHLVEMAYADGVLQVQEKLRLREARAMYGITDSQHERICLEVEDPHNQKGTLSRMQRDQLLPWTGVDAVMWRYSPEELAYRLQGMPLPDPRDEVGPDSWVEYGQQGKPLDQRGRKLPPAYMSPLPRGHDGPREGAIRAVQEDSARLLYTSAQGVESTMVFEQNGELYTPCTIHYTPHTILYTTHHTLHHTL
jgi:hypothetical protein